MTFEEVLLWDEIKGNQLGVDFDRQRPIGKYIVDFYCKDLMLAIEVDGSDHEPEKDDIRQAELEKHGITFLRFTNQDVRKDTAWVVDTIATYVQEHKSEKGL